MCSSFGSFLLNIPFPYTGSRAGRDMESLLFSEILGEGKDFLDGFVVFFLRDVTKTDAIPSPSRNL